MSVTIKVIIPAKIVESSQTTQYTVPSNATTYLDHITATNYSAAIATISVNIVTLADTSGNQNLITKTKALQPAEVYTFPELVGTALAAGGFISTIAGTSTAINIRANGREITQ